MTVEKEVAQMIRGRKGNRPSSLMHPSSPHPISKAPLVNAFSLKGGSAIELFRKGRWRERAFLLEGSPGGWFDGRFSLIGGDPFAVFRSKGKTSRFDYLEQGRERSFSSVGDPVAHLESWFDRFLPSAVSENSPSDIPFLHGGAVGFFSYDLVRQFEKVPPPLQEDPTLPDIYLLFLNHVLVFDHREERLHLIYTPLPEIQMGKDPQSANRDGQKKIEKTQRNIEASLPTGGLEPSGSPIDLHPDILPQAYLRMVERAKQYIAAGDIFQANLSHRFAALSSPDPFMIYRRLRQINPSPFSAYLNMGEIEVASGSPERLVRLRKENGKRIVETRPIAGTRPRGKDLIEDQKMIRQLYESEKEQAEHLMLVDLERNDLGKICRYGSVQVDSLMALEKYSHVLHLVSQVSGEPRPETSPLQVFKALFPGGTITGVPKIRCMQIISELEKTARGIYTGAIGYISFSGEMDLNIAIRTWVRHHNTMAFQVGAGIVADSDPELEYQETLQKAAALMKALQEPS